MLTLAPWLCGQVPSFEGKPVTAVVYQPDRQSLSTEEIAAIQPIRAGDRYSSEQIAVAIDALFATGRYGDIRVEAEPDGEGVRLRFVTIERWFNGGVSVEGKVKDPPTRGQLINATNLPLGVAFDEEAVKNAEGNLRRLFESNGLYGATVTPELTRDPTGNQIHFTFRVNAGKRDRYTRPVITGDTKLSENAIVKATGWRYRIIGLYKRVRADRTRDAVRRLQEKYQSEDRLMAKIAIESLEHDPATNRLKPTIRIDAGPKVEVRALEADVSKKNLKKYVPIYEQRTVDRDLLVEGARNLRDYFQNKGYYDVDVDFRQREEGPDRIAIEYVIAQGNRYKVVAVNIAGNQYFSEEAIRERLFVHPATLALRRGRYSEAMRNKDEENIANLYKSNGFRDVKVTSTVDRNFKGEAGELGVTYNIEEGQQWFVGELNLDGVSKLPREEIVGRLASVEGQPFSEFNVATDRNAILNEYYVEGFPDADFQYRAIPAAEPNTMNLTYIVKEGSQQFVRDVLITGLKTTRLGLVERNLRIQAGQPLSPVSMLDSQRRLYDLGIFARVNAAIQNQEGSTSRKYVLFDIEEAARYTLNVGFGAELAQFGPTVQRLDTPAAGTGFSPRISMDVSRMNFLGLGHVASLRGRWSTLSKQASFNYLAPRFRNRDGRNVTFTALYDDSHDVRTFASRRQEASLQISEQLSKPTTALFRLTYRRVSTSDVAIPALLVPSLLQPVRIGMFSANLAQDRRDDQTDPRRGIFNTLDVGIATKFLASQRDFLRTLGRNATYHRITRNVVFARQTTLGLLFPFSVPPERTEAEAVPLPERFFGGGSTSHRGFGDNQAGPRDIGTPAGRDAVATSPTGFPLGGNALFFNNLELRFPLLGENIRGVLFHDAGNIFSRIGKFSFRQSQRNLQDFDYMVHAVGFGIRYKTPVGPVRGDIAYSLNPPSFVGFKGTVQELLQCNPNVPVEQLPTVCRGVQQNAGHIQFFFSIGQTF